MEEMPLLNFVLSCCVVRRFESDQEAFEMARSVYRDGILKIWQGQIASWPHGIARRQFSFWFFVRLS